MRESWDQEMTTTLTRLQENKVIKEIKDTEIRERKNDLKLTGLPT